MEHCIGMAGALNASIHVGCSQDVMGRTQPDHGIGIDLRNAREKTATGNRTNTTDVQHMNEGRHGGRPKYGVTRS